MAKGIKDIIVDQVNEDKFAVATAIVERAKKGDNSALKILEKFIDNDSEEEQEFPISDERFKQIICAAADRFRLGL